MRAGTWPIEPEQSVWLTWRVDHSDGTSETGQADAVWQSNEGVNSYLLAALERIHDGSGVRIHAATAGRRVVGVRSVWCTWSQLDVRFPIAVRAAKRGIVPPTAWAEPFPSTASGRS